MAANRNLTFAVAGVALGIFGLSLLLFGLSTLNNLAIGQIASNSLLGLGVFLAFLGFVAALASAIASKRA